MTAKCSTTEKPCDSSHSNCLRIELSKLTFSALINANAKKLTLRFAVISLLSCLTEPEHRFLGFLYLAAKSVISSLIMLKSEYFITAFSSDYNSPVYGILRGIFLNTFALFVITSPTSPLPLVTALYKLPSL